LYYVSWGHVHIYIMQITYEYIMQNTYEYIMQNTYEYIMQIIMAQRLCITLRERCKFKYSKNNTL